MRSLPTGCAQRAGVRLNLGPERLLLAFLYSSGSIIAMGSGAGPIAGQDPAGVPTLFEDSFDGATLAGWRFPMGDGARLVTDDTGSHGGILCLETGALPAYALIEGSEEWDGARIEGAVLFPDPGHSYLGFIYRYQDDGRRIDFGSLYIKGNDSYVQANPHFDTNVGRTLYPEMRVALDGPSAVRVGEWQSFRLEVVEGEAHLYVGPVAEPSMTFPFGAPERGAFGFKARNPGRQACIDDLRVVPLTEFSYAGPRRPDVSYRPDELITEWEVLGPLQSFQPDVEVDADTEGPFRLADGRRVDWEPFASDPRGAVVTSRVTEYRGGRRVAYFRTDLRSDVAREAVLEFASADALAMWLNGDFVGFGPAQSTAWWDAAPETPHEPVRATVALRPGSNRLLVRAIGGTYASGGFFLRVRD